MTKRALVLEDEPLLFDLLHDLLHFEGYEVFKPDSLQTLVPEMLLNPPDAVIIDVNLKGVSGLDLVEQIRAEKSFKNTYVLLTSGLDYREESIQRGASDFLQKPYMPDELVKLLDQRAKH